MPARRSRPAVLVVSVWPPPTPGSDPLTRVTMTDDSTPDGRYIEMTRSSEQVLVLVREWLHQLAGPPPPATLSRRRRDGTKDILHGTLGRTAS